MSPEHREAMNILGLLVAIIFIAIMGSILLAYRAKQKRNLTHLESKTTSLEGMGANPEIEPSLPQVEKPKAPVTVEEPKTLSAALSNTKSGFWGRISSAFATGTVSNLEGLEEVLYTSDLGPTSVQRLLSSVEDKLSRSEKKDSEIVRSALREEMLSIFSSSQAEVAGLEVLSRFKTSAPSVWMIIGVNGAGKTTSIGKLSALLAQNGKKVLVAAGDTFRAAAGEQLKVWTERAQSNNANAGLVDIFSPQGVTDPSAVTFDAVSMGRARGFDVVIVDTAGRLHTQANLMDELKKMKRVIQKVMPEAPHETLLVLDSNQGQNALLQAKEFHKALGVTGVVLTKMDGTAKGGVALGVACELQVPIKVIGVGEKLSDLKAFEAREFVEAIL